MRYRALLLLLIVAWAAASASPALARSITIESFQADVLVRTDGTIDVTETIRPRFTGSWNGMYRLIPVEYRTPQGFGYRLLLDLVGVTDEMGRALKCESSRERHYRKFKIWIPGASDATRTVVLHYRVENGLRFFDQRDELYWNVTGDEWDMPIEFAAARVVLPQKAAGVRALAYTGPYGSREQAASVDIGNGLVTVQALRPLAFHEGLTMAVAWNPGVVRRPGPLKKSALFLRSNSAFGIPLVVFLGMLWLWRTRGRDPRPQPIAPQYEPPDGMTPAELGTLLDNRPDMRDITATLVDLAVRGYLLIEESEADILLGLWHKKEYTFTLRKDSAAWEGLQPHERELLESIFTGQAGESVPLSSLENNFYKHLPALRDRIFEELVRRRYYSARPDKVKQAYLIAGTLIAGLCFLVVAVGNAMQSAPSGGVLVPLLTGGIIVGFGWFMPARSIRGARALEKVLGFEEFLARVEADRFERVVKTPEMFEKFLPHAMALGVERNWAAAFSGIYRQQPDWYRGGNASFFNASSLTSDLGRMSTQAGGAMASAPRSSGGSGFGGGGGSGGGSGGGGGGGF